MKELDTMVFEWNENGCCRGHLLHTITNGRLDMTIHVAKFGDGWDAAPSYSFSGLSGGGRYCWDIKCTPGRTLQQAVNEAVDVHIRTIENLTNNDGRVFPPVVLQTLRGWKEGLQGTLF